MAALSANSMREQYLDRLDLTTEEYDMGDDIIYMGGMVNLNSSGYAVAAADTAGDTFVGIAAEYKSNDGGSNGDQKIRVYTNGIWKFAHATAAVTDSGSVCYITDDDTVDIDNGTTHSVKCGRVRNLIRSTTAVAYLDTHVLVDIEGCPFTSVANRLGEEGNIATGEIGSPIVLRFDSCTAESTHLLLLTMPFKGLVVDAWSVNTTANGLTWAVTDGSSDIISAVTVAASDKDIDRAGDIDDAKYALAKGGTIDYTSVGALGVVDLYVVILRSA